MVALTPLGREYTVTNNNNEIDSKDSVPIRMRFEDGPTLEGQELRKFLILKML